MKAYLITLAVGLLVGAIYDLLNVRSPAPPVIALIGLLGILIGEQIPPLMKRVFDGHAITVSVLREHCGEHVFGRLPSSTSAQALGSGQTEATTKTKPTTKTAA
jgi:XapX domain-containing protein